VAPKQTIFDAISTGDPARVKRKLARESSAVDERDAEGLSPLMRALYEAKPGMVDVLLAHGVELDLFEAAALGKTELLGTLVGRSKRRANGYSPDGFTPLHLAAFFGQLEAARLLLDRGADIDARSTNTRLRSVTPLHSAIAGHRTGMALLLLERGADVNATQPGGWTPLHQAAANGDLELCKALLKHGAKRLQMSDDRTRPLDFAIENRHWDVVRLLQGGR
jgi:ankyrin repeat protein